METDKYQMRIRVECHAGYRGGERPIRFFLKQRSIEILDIIDQWYGPDYRYFKVRGDDGSVYILRQVQDNEDWELTMFTR